MLDQWFFLAPPRCAGTQIDNAEDPLLVERNNRGGWGLRFAAEPAEKSIGNYPTAEAAARIARLKCTHVRVVETAA